MHVSISARACTLTVCDTVICIRIRVPSTRNNAPEYLHTVTPQPFQSPRLLVIYSTVSSKMNTTVNTSSKMNTTDRISPYCDPPAFPITSPSGNTNVANTTGNTGSKMNTTGNTSSKMK